MLQSDFLQSPLLKDLQTCQSTKSQSSPDPYFFEKGYIKSAHDVSLGGLLTAVSKMCIRGNKGIKIKEFLT